MFHSTRNVRVPSSQLHQLHGPKDIYYCFNLPVSFLIHEVEIYVFLDHLNTFYIILSFYAILPFFYGHMHVCYIGAYYILWILMNSLKVNIDSNSFPIFLNSLLKFFLPFWSIFFFVEHIFSHVFPSNRILLWNISYSTKCEF